MRLPKRDLNLIVSECAPALSQLRNKRFFITGGTGFFGRWLLESMLHADALLGLNAQAVVLTRDYAAFAASAPHLVDSAALRFIEGDVRALPAECDEAAPYDYVVHMATDTAATAQRLPIDLLDSLIGGTRDVLDLAVRSRAASVLVTSSGAVYGRQPPSVTHVPEEYPGAPDPASVSSIYGEGKRVAELLGAAYLAEHDLPVKIARCFAFVGPQLPLSGHFAIGNFIRDALAGQPIQISGDGTPMRSYLYAADLIIWLWTILLAAPPGVPFNVGSSEAMSIADTARAVASRVSPPPPVRIALDADPSALPARYVPSVARAAEMLGLRQTVSLPDAIDRTLNWHRERIAREGGTR